MSLRCKYATTDAISIFGYFISCSEVYIQGKLSTTRSSGPGNFVCYIRSFVISVVINNTSYFIGTGENSLLYQVFAISDLFISSSTVVCQLSAEIVVKFAVISVVCSWKGYYAHII